MIQNGEKNVRNDQLYGAIEFLVLNLDQIEQDLKHLDITIKCLKENIQKIDSELSLLINSNDSNAELFSPTKKTQKNKELEILSEEKKNEEEELESSELMVTSLKARKNNLSNCINCLHDLEDIYNQYQLKHETNVYNECNRDNNGSLLGIKVLETQENERKRIARDLHDSTAQNMTNIMHKTELCTRLVDIDPIRAKLELQTMVQTIKSTINDMRNIIYDLRPMSIDDLGLIPTIERYIKAYSKEVDIELKVNSETKNVLPVINQTLFRIVQEAINNSIKHGKAKKITIELNYEEEFIFLTVCDNGIGFKQESGIEVGSNILSGFGLSIMKERVLLLTGEINIESNDKNGTKIFVKVPLRIHKEDY